MPSVLEQEVQEQSVVAAGLEKFNVPYFIFSMHYFPVKEERDYKTKVRGGYRTVYRLEPVKSKDDRPSMLIIKDGYQKVFVRTDSQTGRRIFDDKAEPAINIANDIVRVARGVESSDENAQRPAVWISKASKIPVSDADWADFGAPSWAARFPEFNLELEWAKGREWAWCEGKVKEADGFYAEDKHIYIGVQHRMAGDWIGANSAEHPWIKATTFGTAIPCPSCGAKTSSIAPRCQNCKEIINVAAWAKFEAARKRELEAAEARELDEATRPAKPTAKDGKAA